MLFNLRNLAIAIFFVAPSLSAKELICTFDEWGYKTGRSGLLQEGIVLSLTAHKTKIDIEKNILYLYHDTFLHPVALPTTKRQNSKFTTYLSQQVLMDEYGQKFTMSYNLRVNPTQKGILTLEQNGSSFFPMNAIGTCI
ncbi:MAG: hypothetical protein O3A45_02445 [Proteobacteria bacterium]|jgi:hypothetical protein|nr:hypothetical protein [Pseudomonadota bacterium]MDA1238380.1 hypothetical protein [Pseudomonadota bacterium]